MTEKEKEYIKVNLKWPFNWFDFFRYIFVVAPLSLALVSFSMFYGGFKFGHIYKNNFMNSFFFTALIGLIISLFLTYYFIKQIRNDFKFLSLALPNNITSDNVPEKNSLLQWRVAAKENNTFLVATKTTLFSWGEWITIIKVDEKNILINSRPAGRQPFTFNRNKINYKKLEALLLKTPATDESRVFAKH